MNSKFQDTTLSEKEYGFSLIEVLISLVLLTVVLSGVIPAFASFSSKNSFSEMRMEAIQAVEMVMDDLRMINPNTLPTSGNDGSQIITVNNHAFNVTTFFCETPAYCSSINNRHIRVVAERNGLSLYEAQTVYTQLR